MKFKVLQREFLAVNPKEQFGFFEIEAEDENMAWEIVEESISTNNSQEWLLNKGELNALKEVLK